MGNINSCFIPANDKTSQYIVRAFNCEFVSDNFDEALTGGRLTKLEVDQTLKKLKQQTGGFQQLCRIITIYFVLFIL